MTTGYIYQIINTSNNHSYIGYTQNFISRMNRHFNCHGDSLIYRAFRKHGIDNFIVKILEQPIIQNLPEREKYWIKFFDTHHNGYNMTPGGDGGPTTKNRKKKPHSLQTKQKMSEDRKGIKRTQESKQKQSESVKGNKNPRFIFLSNLQINQILDFYKNKKLTIKEIAIQIKTSPYKIRCILKEQNIYLGSRNPR